MITTKLCSFSDSFTAQPWKHYRRSISVKQHLPASATSFKYQGKSPKCAPSFSQHGRKHPMQDILKRLSREKLCLFALFPAQNRIMQHCLCLNWIFLKDILHYCVILHSFHWEIKADNDTLFTHLHISSSLSELCCILCIILSEIRLLGSYGLCFLSLGRKCIFCLHACMQRS